MRLLTRSDFDGLACAAILKDLGLISDWKFVHPKDIQDGAVDVGRNDILANVPYDERCKMWFDHHTSEQERLSDTLRFEGESRPADSAARVIYEYYGGREQLPFFDEMVTYVDRVDAGKLTKDEILHPTGWILLGFLMDPRTGLGRFRDFTISNYQLMELLIDKIQTCTIDEIMKLPDIIERVTLYFEQDALFRDMVAKHTVTNGNVIATDLRGVSPIYAGNRFLLYSLYPDQNISVWLVDGRDKLNCSVAVGYSILNRTATVNVGALMLRYGGGGHPQVGTCQVPYEDADNVIRHLCKEMNK
ncbi:MAG: exopolyphosphatase [Clostridiales bacterium]|jgi:nanoRNase/pAp phosphatase (c-di-AMP/oligoRNAs hydrolase)|nr:exopolyphosphatase [Clostridiales bacterium]